MRQWSIIREQSWRGNASFHPDCRAISAGGTHGRNQSRLDSAPPTVFSTAPRGRPADAAPLIVSFLPAAAPVVIGFDNPTQDLRPKHPSRSRPLLEGPLRQSRWFALAFRMLLVHLPWADLIMALRSPTLPAPSKRFYAGRLQVPKTLIDWARQAALQIRRWLPDRYIVLVADS